MESQDNGEKLAYYQQFCLSLIAEQAHDFRHKFNSL